MQRRVVVTGIGVISPVGNDAGAFWDAMVQGKSGIDYITKFDTSDFKVKIAAEVKGFDPLVYMDKKEVRRNDLYCQYAMGAAMQAMQDSGLVVSNGEDGDAPDDANMKAQISPERLGVYFGSGVGGMITFANECEKLLTAGPKKISPFFVPMIISNIAAGTIAIQHQAQGPCLPIVTACATGTHAIGEAFRAIKFGFADAIIAGGAEATIIPLSVAGFTNCMALTTRNDIQNGSIPFDARRDGFVMGEGSGALILEEYERAKQRGAKIYGEIAGYGNTCDAHHITAPHPEAQGAAKAISLAIEEAGLQAELQKSCSDVYYNAHGTSTPLNDKAETFAVKKVLGEKAYELMISSTKSMTGHMLGAAGAVEAIASLLALQNGVVPPTIGYAEKDPDCDLDYVPNEARVKEVCVALSTSLGFGGHNACLAFRKVSKTDAIRPAFETNKER